MADISRPSGYETADADSRLIAALALSTALFLLATPYLLRFVYPDADRHGEIPRVLPQPPAPRLQVQPMTDLDRLRAIEHRQLETFGWADRDHKSVRVPIERAMQLLIERGLTDWCSAPAVSK